MPYNRLASVGIGALLAALGPSGAVIAQCQGWLPGNGPTVSGTFKAATMFDPDGAGPTAPELIVAGTFQSLGGQTSQINYIGKWDGVSWGNVIPVNTFGFNEINALAVFDVDG